VYSIVRVENHTQTLRDASRANRAQIVTTRLEMEPKQREVKAIEIKYDGW